MIRALRLRPSKNLLATLLLLQGVPMLMADDEFDRTQRGNNAYCQAGEISWLGTRTPPPIRASRSVKRDGVIGREMGYSERIAAQTGASWCSANCWLSSWNLRLTRGRADWIRTSDILNPIQINSSMST